MMRVKNHQMLATMRVDTALQLDTSNSTNGTHTFTLMKYVMEGTQRQECCLRYYTVLIFVINRN
jgi:hypothetical protein